MASGVSKTWNGSALDIILVGPYGSHLYAGESDSSIFRYCSAPKRVSEISSPGNKLTLISCWAPTGDQTPLKSRAHRALAAGEFGFASAADRCEQPHNPTETTTTPTTDKIDRTRLLTVNLLRLPVLT